MSGQVLDVEVVIPHANKNGALHYRFQHDYKTFCGKTCEGWSVSDETPATCIENAYLCKTCRIAYLK